MQNNSYLNSILKCLVNYCLNFFYRSACFRMLFLWGCTCSWLCNFILHTFDWTLLPLYPCSRWGEFICFRRLGSIFSFVGWVCLSVVCTSAFDFGIHTGVGVLSTWLCCYNFLYLSLELLLPVYFATIIRRSFIIFFGRSFLRPELPFVGV